MVVKVYISGISGNKEVKKRQQRVLMILDSKNIKYDVIDITEPGRESDKDFMQNNAKANGGTVSDPNPRSPLPPQLFNDDEYCGDYDQFDLANEVDTLEQFLKVEVPPEQPPQENTLNGDVVSKESKENSQEREPTEPVVEKEKSPAKEEDATTKASSRDGTPLNDSVPVDESKPDVVSQEKDESEGQKSADKEESSTEKEQSPVKESEVEAKKSSKDSSPVKDDAVNENGTVSSREQSQGRDAPDVVDRKKDDPSETLIQSEQLAASD